jgi:3-dehydroquinate dehydratase-2
MNVIIINGPNLNLLGKRETSIYGKITFEDFLIQLRRILMLIKFIIIKAILR